MYVSPISDILTPVRPHLHKVLLTLVDGAQANPWGCELLLTKHRVVDLESLPTPGTTVKPELRHQLINGGRGGVGASGLSPLPWAEVAGSSG
ncbi:hypothetical protein KEM60_01304 [Austwickia sp. TVS 96-490-7B]|nr:hypothetical protein [Austwickia sp. TVS 96-490-7B]